MADTTTGRFELYTLHVVLLAQRLRGAGALATEVSQALFDAYLLNLDIALREMGVGDLSVGKKIQGEVTPITGANPDQEVVVSNTGYWMGPDITIASAGKGRVRAYGRVWDFDGRSAEICQINWHGPN